MTVTITDDKVLSPVAVSDNGSSSDNEGSSPIRERANRNFGEKVFLSWFDKNDGPVERRLITKIDFFILSYAFIGFWVFDSPDTMLSSFVASLPLMITCRFCISIVVFLRTPMSAA